MKTRFTFWLLAVMILSSCASLPQRMNRAIDKGNYNYAVVQGEKYLAKGKPDQHETGVRQALEKGRYKVACQADSPDGYQSFHETYPQSMYTDDVLQRWARVLYEETIRKTDTLAAYEAFVRQFPTGTYTDQARDRMAILEWRQVELKGTLDAYRQYRQQFPSSPRAGLALNKEMALAWQVVEKMNSIDGYYTYAKSYLDTEMGKAAMRLAHHMGWNLARREDSIHRWEWFRTQFPDSPHYTAAYQREVTLAWAHAEAKDDEATYRWFLARYPDTALALIAEQRADDWAYFNSDRRGELPMASVHQVNDRDMSKVWLYLDVRGRNNTQVSGLRPEQFTVFENGRSAPVTDFLGMESKRPIDIVFLIDLSGSMQDEIDTVRTSIMGFAEELRFRQRDVAFGLISFCDDVHEVFGGGKTTSSAGTFQGWMSTLTLLNLGTENPLQAIWRATQYRFRKDTQKVIVLITDEPPNVPYDRKSGMNAHDIGKLLLDGDFTFYAIAPRDPQYDTILAIGGGRHFEISEYPDQRFALLMNYIGTVLSNLYRIAYSSPRNIPTGQDRKLRVRVQQQQTWLSRSELEGQLVALFPVEGQDCQLLGVTRQLGIWASKDCGVIWEPLRDLVVPSAVVAATGAVGSTVQLYLLLEDGRMAAVRSLTQLEIIGAELKAAVTSIAWSSAFPDRVWASCSNGVWLSENRGTTFSRLGGLPGNIGSVVWVATASSKQRLCFFEDSGAVWCQQGADGGWQRLQATAAPEAMPALTKLFSCPWNDDLLFLRWGESSLYRSLDGGRSWHLLALPDSGRLGGVFFVAVGRRICLAAEKGLYCSTNRGGHWLELTDGTYGVSDWSTASFGTDARGRMFLIAPDGRRIYQLYEVATREMVSGEVYFSSNSDEPKRDLIPHLQQMGRMLAQDRTLRARVDGHTDSDGPDEYNLDLSRRRAERVRNHLLAGGATPAQVEVIGHGETRPIVPNSSESNKAKNRRVEILMIRDFAGN